MSRDDLLSKNVGIMRTISERISSYAPDSIVIVVSNPVDVLTYAALKITGFPKNRVMGMAGVGGEPLTKLFSPEKLEELVNRTKFGGGEIVELMGTSAYHAPGASVVEMVEAILEDKKEIMPCSI